MNPADQGRPPIPAGRGERPPAPHSPRQPPQASLPPQTSPPPEQPRTAPPPEPPPTSQPPSAPRESRIRRTRAGSIWVSLTVGGLFLVALLIFVVQNTGSVRLGFLGWHFMLPVGVAILVAAVAGLLVMAVAGSIRIIQLRQAFSKLNRKAAARTTNGPA